MKHFLLFFIFVAFSQHAFAVTLFSGQYGIGNYFSQSVDEINRRLGNSPALEVPTQFGRNNGIYAEMLIADKPKKFIFQTGYFGLFENISAKSDTTLNKMRASLSLHQLIVGVGTQIWPPSKGGSRNSSNARPSRLSQMIYVTAYLQSGAYMNQHSFLLDAPSTGTNIEYETTALGYHFGGAVRASTILYPGLEMHADLALSLFKPNVQKQTLKKFLVSQQDLSYTPEKAKLGELTRSPIYLMRFGVGITFNLSP